MRKGVNMGKLYSELEKEMKKAIKKEYQPKIDELKKTYKELEYEVLKEYGTLKTIRNHEEKMLADFLEDNKIHEYYNSIQYECLYHFRGRDDRFTILNCQGDEKYAVKGCIFFGAHRLKIYENGKRIGTIKRKIYAFPHFLDFEYRVKQSITRYDSGEDIQVESCWDVLSWLRKYSVDHDNYDWKIRYVKKDGGYKITCKKEIVACIYPLNSKYWVVGFDSLDYEKDVAMIAVMLRNMFRNN